LTRTLATMARRPGALTALAASLAVVVALLAPATQAFYIPALLPVDYTVRTPAAVDHHQPAP